jgi:hypothetical protein
MPPSKSAVKNNATTSARTVVADLARLIKENKISAAELARVDKDLLAQAESYAATLDIGMFDLASLRAGGSGTVSPKSSNSPEVKPLNTPFSSGMSSSSSSSTPTSTPTPAPTQAKVQPQQSPYSAYSTSRFNPTFGKAAGTTSSTIKPKFSRPIVVPGFGESSLSHLSANSSVSGQDHVQGKQKADFSKLKEELQNELENGDAPASVGIVQEPHVAPSIHTPFSPRPSVSEHSESPASSLAAPAIPKAVVSEPPPRQLTEDEQLAKEEADLQRNADNIQIEFTAAEEDVAGSKAKLKENSEYFSSLAAKEGELESREADVRKRVEGAATLRERKVIEEERWTIEDARRKIEEERWQKNQEKKIFEKDVEDKEAASEELAKRKKVADESLEKIKIRREAKKAKDDIMAYKKKLEEVEAEKKADETNWQAQNAAEMKAKKDIEDSAAKVKELDAAISGIEAEEKKAKSEEIRHIHEERRWKAEQELRDTEKSSWQQEESIEAMESMKQSLEAKFADYQIEEEQLKTKIKELEDIITKAG